MRTTTGRCRACKVVFVWTSGTGRRLMYAHCPRCKGALAGTCISNMKRANRRYYGGLDENGLSVTPTFILNKYVTFRTPDGIAFRLRADDAEGLAYYRRTDGYTEDASNTKEEHR